MFCLCTYAFLHLQFKEYYQSAHEKALFWLHQLSQFDPKSELCNYMFANISILMKSVSPSFFIRIVLNYNFRFIRKYKSGNWYFQSTCRAMITRVFWNTGFMQKCAQIKDDRSKRKRKWKRVDYEWICKGGNGGFSFKEMLVQIRRKFCVCMQIYILKRPCEISERFFCQSYSMFLLHTGTEHNSKEKFVIPYIRKQPWWSWLNLGTYISKIYF